MNTEARPGVHGRIDITERELIRRQLTGGVSVSTTKEQRELISRESRVQASERNHVKREVPGGIPGVLPLVGDRDDVVIDDMRPVLIASGDPLLRGFGLCGIPNDPIGDVEVIELFGPKQRCISLAEDVSFVVGSGLGQKVVVEELSLVRARGQGLLDLSQSWQPVAKVPPRRKRIFSASSALPNLEILPVFLRFVALI